MKVLINDWNKHKKAAVRALFALWVYRFGRWTLSIKFWPLKKIMSLIYFILQPISELISGIYLHRDTKIGEDPHFIHAGNTQINPAAVLGDRVGIMHGVTIGSEPSDPKLPVIGNDVFLGVNSTILGGVTLGDGVTVAANSLVISDVPEGCLAIGVPAKVLPKGFMPGSK
jgi:serine O-acetyltransferase